MYSPPTQTHFFCLSSHLSKAVLKSSVSKVRTARSHAVLTLCRLLGQLEVVVEDGADRPHAQAGLGGHVLDRHVAVGLDKSINLVDLVGRPNRLLRPTTDQTRDLRRLWKP